MIGERLSSLNQFVETEEVTASSSGHTPIQGYKKHKELGEMTPQKEQIKSPVTDNKEMEIYKVTEKECKIIMLKKSSELQENTDNSMKSGKQNMIKMRNSTKREKV